MPPGGFQFNEQPIHHLPHHCLNIRFPHISLLFIFPFIVHLLRRGGFLIRPQSEQGASSFWPGAAKTNHTYQKSLCFQGGLKIRPYKKGVN
jgi:hypothetical protein